MYYKYGKHLYEINSQDVDKIVQSFRRKMAHIQNELKKEKHKCLIPSCNKKAIKSHSVQKSKHLKNIAEQGKVHGKSINYIDVESFLNGKMQFEDIGINKASTFDGFCAFHDNELFKDIEKGDYSPDSLRHNCLLYLRSISHEICFLQA